MKAILKIILAWFRCDEFSEDYGHDDLDPLGFIREDSRP
jgi:hypothetical protein